MGELGGVGLIGGVIGGIGGAIGGYFQGQAADQASRDLRKQIRAGVGQAQADTVRQTAAYLGSSEYQQANNFIRGLYGMGRQDPMEQYNQLLGLYGGNAGLGYGGPGGAGAAGAFGYGLKDYGNGGNSIAAQNQAYVLRALGITPQAAGLGNVQVQSGPGSVAAIGQRVAGTQISQAGLPGDVAAGQFSGNVQAGQDLAAANNATAGAASMLQDNNNPLLQNFNKQLSQTLAARGLGSGMSAAGTVASGLAGYQTQLQLEQLPTLLNMAAQPFTFANTLGGFGGNANRDVFAATGGQAVYGQVSQAAMDTGPMAGLRGAMAGGLAGFSSGASLGINYGGAQSQNRRNNAQTDYYQSLVQQQSQGNPYAGFLGSPTPGGNTPGFGG